MIPLAEGTDPGEGDSLWPAWALPVESGFQSRGSSDVVTVPTASVNELRWKKKRSNSRLDTLAPTPSEHGTVPCRVTQEGQVPSVPSRQAGALVPLMHDRTDTSSTGHPLFGGIVSPFLTTYHPSMPAPHPHKANSILSV